MGNTNRYQKYLLGDAWLALRDEVMDRAGGFCELCGRGAIDVHHIKYPQNLKDDNARNLLAVCRFCHDKLHGVNKIINYKKIFYSILDDLRVYLINDDMKEKLPALRSIYNKHVSELYDE